MQSVGQHRERRKLGQRAFENCDMLKELSVHFQYSNISLIKKLEYLSYYTELLYRKYNRLMYNSLLHIIIHKEIKSECRDSYSRVINRLLYSFRRSYDFFVEMQSR